MHVINVRKVKYFALLSYQSLLIVGNACQGILSEVIPYPQEQMLKFADSFNTVCYHQQFCLGKIPDLDPVSSCHANLDHMTKVYRN